MTLLTPVGFSGNIPVFLEDAQRLESTLVMLVFRDTRYSGRSNAHGDGLLL